MFLERSDWPHSVVSRAMALLNHQIELPYGFGGKQVVLASDYSLDHIHTSDVCFPKLGPKSWRDTGSGNPVLAGIGLRARLDRLLRNISDQQGYLVREIARAGEPLFLYLFEWVDYSSISEFRVRVTDGEVGVSSSCLRYDVGEGCHSDVLAFAKDIAEAFGCDDMIVDVAYLPSGECKLVEVNPPNRQVSLQGASSYVRLAHV